MFPNVAGALITVLSLVAAIIVGLYVLSYAAHSLVTIVEGTAAGNDVIKWPDEPIPDWIGRGIFFGALLLIWVGPSAMVARALRDDWLVDNAGLRFVLLAVPGLWLFFPISLLSSLSASSKWMVFRSSIVGVLLRVFPSTLMFYFLTAIISAVCALAWYLAVCKGRFEMLLLAAPLGAAGFLLYARLLGRLSLMIHRLNPTKAERDEKPKKKKKKKRRTPEGKTPVPPADAGKGWDPFEEADELEEVPVESDTRIVRDPSLDLPAPLAVPGAAHSAEEEAEDEFPLQPMERTEEAEKRWDEDGDDGPSDPYTLNSDAPAQAPEYRPAEDFDSEEMGPQVPVERHTGEGIVTHFGKPHKRARPLRFKPVAPPVLGPRHPWWQGVYDFPFYATSLGAWAWLTVGFAVFGLFCGLVVEHYPTGE